jgi:hypothetical protein
VVLKDGIVPLFRTLRDLKVFASTEGLALEDEDPDDFLLVNLDTVAHWLKLKQMKRSRRVDCPVFLNAWNLFEDFSHTVGANFDPNKGPLGPFDDLSNAGTKEDLDKGRTDKIYAKIFWGNNLPSLTPPVNSTRPSGAGKNYRLFMRSCPTA